MTREEAIAYGKRVIDLGLNDETQAFCELAIKALEQEPKIVPIAVVKFDDDMLHEMVEEAVKNIVVEYDFKGKTNGEVIKMLFPNIDNYFSNVIDLRLWWNSPYKGEKE